MRSLYLGVNTIWIKGCANIDDRMPTDAVGKITAKSRSAVIAISEKKQQALT